MSQFNVRDYGATGRKDQEAQSAIQKAIDACAEAEGGVVYFPPGEYTTGTLQLRSRIRMHVEAGATVYSSKKAEAWIKTALFYGEDLEHISIEGRGVIDGQGKYTWRITDHDDRYIMRNQRRMEAAGKPLKRAFPEPDCVGHLVLLIRCTDVSIRDLSFIDSPSWTMHLWGCERMVIDGVYVHTSREAGVWADGIDPNGCKDLRISNCTIDTGDDALVFYSGDGYGPARPCENITVTNCRLSSASSALKFCDGIKNCVRNVTIDNCVITDSNRGIAFMMFDEGYISDVVISNITIECRRYDWFWWGEGDPIHFNILRYRDLYPEKPDEGFTPAGSIRNVLLKNIIATGAGPSIINGHPDSWLEDVTLEDIKLTVRTDPKAPYPIGGNALTVQRARNIRMRNVEVAWEEEISDEWHSALLVEDVDEFELAGFRGRQAFPGSADAAVILNRVREADIQGSHADVDTGTFLDVKGVESHGIYLAHNDLRRAKKRYTLEDGLDSGIIEENGNR